MEVRKWTVVIVFDAREDSDYMAGYVKQYERVLKLQEDMERLVLERAKELDFRQFYRRQGGVSRSEVAPREVAAETNLFSRGP